ncbi:MAG: mechanosensitive ion channel family protein [Thermoprotei archaeon]
MSVKNGGRLVGYTVLVIVVLLVLGIVLYYALSLIHLIPINFLTYVKVVITGIVGYIAVYLVGRELQRLLRTNLGPHRAYPIFFLFRVVSYLLLIALILAVAGVNTTALLAGGTFAGLVVGLAGQTVLSNFFAGLLIVLAKPFSVGDRVTAFGWQYGMSFPYYFPKFYSKDNLIPALTGKIMDVTMNYTTILLDEGVEVKIPNNVVITMGFIVQDVETRWVRVRYELPPSFENNLDDVLSLILKAVKENEWVVQPDDVKVNVEAITQSSVLIVVDAVCKGAYEDPPRSSILMSISKAISPLKSVQKKV